MASMESERTSSDAASVTVMRSPSADRNKDAILRILKEIIPHQDNYKVLEIASGTGQHVVHFAQNLPHVTWTPSECDTKSLQSIAGYTHVTLHNNVHQPLWIDATHAAEEWAGGSLTPASSDLVLAINMIHISPWAASEGVFKGSGYYLKCGGILVTYGPYAVHGEIKPESNIQFDRMLRQQNAEWGLRDVDDLEKLAKANGMLLSQVIEMPTNNKILVFRKQSDSV